MSGVLERLGSDYHGLPKIPDDPEGAISKLQLTRPSAVLVLSFLAAIVLGTGLLMLLLSHARGDMAPFLTALFTATSAVL